MEEIKKIEVQGQQYGVADMLMRSVMGGNAQVIEWSHTHNMNDYKDAGTYRIKGERTGSPMDDNLPIMNQGSGHTIEGILYVLDSSLANGSGNSDDCTITQFLMLSNRVGGQEGDMYMRSAYGANKDSLTWKPWEKYQTNMEVGVVSDNHLLNPSNPTEILKKDSGMINLRDNGIYSGIYFGPKCMVGTGEDNWHISFQDATAIETFVMIVINNYAAASNARCITQIKFAVTNGGVFSMEKRSTSPESLYFSQWESVGSGSSNSLINKPNTFNSSSLVLDDVALNLKFSTYSGDWDIVAKKASLEFIDKKTDVQCIISREGLIIGTDTNGGYVAIGNEVKIGNNVTIGNDVTLNAESFNCKYGLYDFRFLSNGDFVGSVKFRPSNIGISRHFNDPDFGYNSRCYVSIGVNDVERNTGGQFQIDEFIEKEDGSNLDKTYSLRLTNDGISFNNLDIYKDEQVTTNLPYGLTIEPSEDGNKLLISYNGKTAELQLT